jgi:hypothetical protein
LTGPFKLSRRKEILLDFLLVFLYTAMLIRPYFKAKYTDKWASIESTFIADARFLAAHWPHPQWQPLWYAGTRFDYIYPPLLRYGTAAISKVTGFWPVKAYHFYVSLLYAVGIAAVYLLIRVGMKSRGAAWLGAVATSLMSPIFLFMPRFRGDAWKLQPQRLGVLVKYGEGPHMSALALIPIALAFTWLALEKRRPWAIAGAAFFSAAVAANNFYGATALATLFPILIWSFWITRQQKWIVLPALAIPALAYGLTASWLVPSYFKVTAENMKYVSEHGTTWSIWVALVVAVAFAITTDKLAREKRDRTWEVFVAGSVVFFSLNVLGNFYFNFRISGEPTRLLPELDMVYIFGILLLLRWMWNRPGIVLRGVAIVLVAAAFYSAKGYIRHAWHMFPLWPDYQNRVEYKVTDWLWKNMPDSRTYPTGSVRFWFDTWHDLAQLGGGSEQGLLNGQVEPAQWEINLGPKASVSILWMQDMGVDAVYVADKQSQEIFKDFQYPHKFDGVLTPIYDSHQGDVIYRIPRRWTALARVVETAKLDVLTANVAPGQSIVVQESYDPAWRAWVNGKPAPVRKDAMGMIVIDAPPGDDWISLMFITPLENRVGAVLTVLSLLIILSLAVAGIRMERRA